MKHLKKYLTLDQLEGKFIDTDIVYEGAIAVDDHKMSGWNDAGVFELISFILKYDGLMLKSFYG